MDEDEVLSRRQNGHVSSDDETPTLSLHALAALKEFLNERENVAAEGGVEQLLTHHAGPVAGNETVSLVSEDWRLSQFWYDPETAERVAKEVIALASNAGVSSRIACIACPTLYPYIKKLDSTVDVQLLEYDQRFEKYGADFTFYDYNQPEQLPNKLNHSFGVVVADPPYLSRECLEKVSQTITFLARSKDAFVLLLTGAVQKEKAAELLGLHPCGFRPQHASKLGNEFRLFTNYDPGMRLGGWKMD